MDGPVGPGETIGTWTKEYTVTEDDAIVHWIVNQAYATVIETFDVFYSNQADAWCDETPYSEISIKKEVTSSPAVAPYYGLGETVTYLVTITNEGKVPLSGSVYDILPGTQTETFYDLQPGQALGYTFTHNVTEYEYNVQGYVENYALVSFINSEGKSDGAMSNIVYVYCRDVPPPPPVINPLPVSACEVTYDKADKPVLSHCEEHEAVHAWASTVEPAMKRALWEEALDAEYELYLNQANGQAKVSLLSERMRFSNFLRAREQALKNLYAGDQDKIDTAIAEILEQKVVLMCYEIHEAPEERTGFASGVTGTGEKALREQLSAAYDKLGGGVLFSDASSFSSWLGNRKQVLEVLYPDDTLAVQKSLEQEILDNIRRLGSMK